MGDRTRQGGVLPRVRGGGKDGGVDAVVKLAALRVLLGLAMRGAKHPPAIDESKRQRLCALLVNGADAAELCDELDMPVDNLIAVLWRMTG